MRNAMLRIVGTLAMLWVTAGAAIAVGIAFLMYTLDSSVEGHLLGLEVELPERSE